MDRAVFIHNTLRDFVSHFAFGVVDDNIIIGHEKSIGNFTLCGEGFAGTGRTQNQAIGVLEPLAVHHDKVVGEGVQAIVQRFPPGLIKFLGGKGHKNGCAAGGQPSLNLNLTVSQRQAAHQPLLLLEIHPTQVAVVLLGNGAGLKDVVFQFLLRASSVQHQKGNKEHPLVLALQFFQQSLCVTAIGCQIGRNNVDIISGTDCLLLVE